MYSALLNLQGKKVTVVGGGEVAFRKVCSFIEEGCKVYVLAPYLIEAFQTLQNKIHIENKVYEEGDGLGSFVMVAATDNAEVNRQIGEFCERENILCNVVDNKALSTFIVPSTLKRGDLTISVSTGGASPFLAAKIRHELEKQYDEHYGEYIERLGRIRQYVLNTVPDELEKKRILKYLITLNQEELEKYEKSYINR